MEYEAKWEPHRVGRASVSDVRRVQRMSAYLWRRRNSSMYTEKQLQIKYEVSRGPAGSPILQYTLLQLG